MSDTEDFEWRDEPGQRTGTALPEPLPNRQPRSLKGDLGRFREQATTSPRRWAAVLALAVAVLAAIVVAVVISTGGNEQTSGPAQTTSPGTTTPQTQPEPTGAPTPRPAITVSPATVLRAGDHGPAVRTLQRALRRLGFAIGSPDGVFGPKTEAAVIAFQRAHRLTADGVVGAATARALNTALAQAG